MRQSRSLKSSAVVIATRMLRLKAGAGAIDIPVEIHAPEQGAEGGWFCRYTVGWPDEPWNSAG